MQQLSSVSSGVIRQVATQGQVKTKRQVTEGHHSLPGRLPGRQGIGLGRVRHDSSDSQPCSASCCQHQPIHPTAQGCSDTGRRRGEVNLGGGIIGAAHVHVVRQGAAAGGRVQVAAAHQPLRQLHRLRHLASRPRRPLSPPQIPRPPGVSQFRPMSTGHEWAGRSACWTIREEAARKPYRTHSEAPSSPYRVWAGCP